MERQYRSQAEELTKWENRAIAALNESERNPREKEKYEGLAKEALARKKDLSVNLETFKDQYEMQKKNTDSLKESLRQLSGKIEEAKRKKNTLIARKRRAEVQQSMQENMAGMNNSNENLFTAFDRMEKKVEQMEIEAGYDDKELLGSSENNVEKDFLALENKTTETDLNLELEELRKMRNDRLGYSGSNNSNEQKNKDDFAPLPKDDPINNDPELDQMMNELKNRFKKNN